MAHFAKLNEGSIVETVEVVSNDVASTEQAGIDFLNNLYGTNDVWKQTSYNTCLLYTSPSPRDRTRSRMPSSA